LTGVGFTAAAGVFMLIVSGLAYGYGRILPTENRANLGDWVRSFLWLPFFLLALFLFALDAFVVLARAMGYRIAEQ